MTTDQIAWAIDGSNDLVLIYEDYQTPPFTGPEWNLVDVTVSASGEVMVLALEGETSIIHYSKQTFPMKWKSMPIPLGKGKQAVKIDASPDNVAYIVLNDGSLGEIKLPEKKGKKATFKSVEGVEHVSQISAAANGLVWVVVSDTKVGSVVKWMDPEKGKWSTIPGLANALKVTGSSDGRAYIIDTAGKIASYTKKGDKDVIPCWVDASQLTIGPDNRLWIISKDPSTAAGSIVYFTDDNGVNWTEVESSGARYLDAGVIASKVGQSIA